MLISEFLNNIKESAGYIKGSLIYKSGDDNGAVYKYLILSGDTGTAIRKEIFVELNPTESNLDLENKTVVSSIEVCPAL